MRQPGREHGEVHEDDQDVRVRGGPVPVHHRVEHDPLLDPGRGEAVLRQQALCRRGPVRPRDQEEHGAVSLHLVSRDVEL